MHIDQALLFMAVAVLALALIVAVVAPRLRARDPEARAARPGQLPLRSPLSAAGPGPNPPPVPVLVCPTCHRRYGPGFRFCAEDARPLVALMDPAVDPTSDPAAAPALVCPVCHREFKAGSRFCPFDAGALAPADRAARSADRGPTRGQPALAFGTGWGGKICPHCARHFDTDATFCGRDGSPLVSVN